MARESWIDGFTHDGKPIRHSENDGPAFIRDPSQSERGCDWADLAGQATSGGSHSEPRLLREALEQALTLNSQDKNSVPLFRLAVELLELKSLRNRSK